MRRHASIFLFGLGLAPRSRPVALPIPRPTKPRPMGWCAFPSRSIGGVYRAPDATFTQYQRLILEPPSISFIKDWTENHPEVSPTELARIRAESVELFRDEFTREFVKRGPYKFADEPAPDVLLVIPAIEELDIMAPERGVRARRTAPI